MKKLFRLVNDSTAQALPLALAALALGSLLVTPFLVNASVNLLASRHVDATIKDYYSADAGVEWALWRLKTDPTLTTNTSYDEAPLQPTPPAVNGFSFPKTQIRYVQGAGMAESITPPWQAGGGPKCYPFASSEAGTIFAMVGDVPPSQVWITLLSDSDPCQTPLGLGPVEDPPPYTVQFLNKPAGSYRLLVETAASGTVTISYPVASYDIRSEMNERTVTSRATASANAVRIVSWQLGNWSGG